MNHLTDIIAGVLVFLTLAVFMCFVWLVSTEREPKNKNSWAWKHRMPLGFAALMLTIVLDAIAGIVTGIPEVTQFDRLTETRIELVEKIEFMEHGEFSSEWDKYAKYNQLYTEVDEFNTELKEIKNKNRFKSSKDDNMCKDIEYIDFFNLSRTETGGLGNYD